MEDFNKNIDWDLILLYLEGNCSEPEMKKLRDWLNESEENKKELELIEKIWKAGEDVLPEANVENALATVKKKIENYNKTSQEESARIYDINEPKQTSITKYFLKSKLFRAAALILIMILGVYLFWQSESKIKLNVVTAENKTIKEVLLPDSSLVQLDAGSTLKYPLMFDDNIREVYLSGEGFFKVFHDSQKPFVVHANNARITVLGTQFNIRTWNDSNKVVVAVAEGKVSLHGEDNEEQKAIISKDEMSILNENGIPSNPQKINIDQYLSWINREMSFQSTSLIEVLNQLERWYDLKFILPDNSYEQTPVTVFIENKPIEEILDVISLMMKFDYEIDNNTIIFESKK